MVYAIMTTVYLTIMEDQVMSVSTNDLPVLVRRQ